jgi:hypothetical protein
MPDLLIRDEKLSGFDSSEFSLSFLTERITVRELIRSRVYQEVQDYNLAKSTQKHRSLVEPSAQELLLNGKTIGHRKSVDWQVQFKTATEAFEAGRIIILINDQQADSLDQEFDIKTKTVVTFLKLTLLVGG